MPISDRDIVEALVSAGHCRRDATNRAREWMSDRQAVVVLQQTLRDNFAMHALQGAIAAHGSVGLTPSITASRAYEFADAMLAERAKGGVA
jgi:hypothetical protein